jgi:hypothetical protein
MTEYVVRIGYVGGPAELSTYALQYGAYPGGDAVVYFGNNREVKISRNWMYVSDSKVHVEWALDLVTSIGGDFSITFNGKEIEQRGLCHYIEPPSQDELDFRNMLENRFFYLENPGYEDPFPEKKPPKLTIVRS